MCRPDLLDWQNVGRQSTVLREARLLQTASHLRAAAPPLFVTQRPALPALLDAFLPFSSLSVQKNMSPNTPK